MAAQRKPQGVRVNAQVLASRYLNALGWPNTPVTRRVLAAWFMRESPGAGGGDIYVIGNNPLNMTTTQGSYWLSGGGTYKIAIFSSPEAGVNAFRNRINGKNWGYPKIVQAFRTNPHNPVPIILAINNSGWVTGSHKRSYVTSTGGNVVNHLVATYNQIGEPDIAGSSKWVYEKGTPYGSGGGGTSHTTPTPTTPELVWGVPEGQTLTRHDVVVIANSIDAAGLFGPNPITAAVAKRTFVDNLYAHVGEPWNKATRDKIQGETGIDANGADVGAGLGKITVDIFGAVAGKGVAIAALFIGVGLVVFGAFLVSKDVFTQAGSGILDTTPIIVRNT